MSKLTLLLLSSLLATSAIADTLPVQPWQNMGEYDGIVLPNDKIITGMITATAFINEQGHIEQTEWQGEPQELVELSQRTGLPAYVEPYQSCTYDETQTQQICTPSASQKEFRFFYTLPKHLRKEAFTKPVKIQSPPYPALAQEAGEEGTVIIGAFVPPTGSTFLYTIKSSGFRRLDKAAYSAVHASLPLHPATYKKQPVAIAYQIPIKFSLESEPNTDSTKAGKTIDSTQKTTKNTKKPKRKKAKNTKK